jgi:hypothetical protein
VSGLVITIVCRSHSAAQRLLLCTGHGCGRKEMYFVRYRAWLAVMIVAFQMWQL